MEQNYIMLEVGEDTLPGDQYFCGTWEAVTGPYTVVSKGWTRRPVSKETHELIDARNQITNLTRRLEEAMYDKNRFITRKEAGQLRATRNRSSKIKQD